MSGGRKSQFNIEDVEHMKALRFEGMTYARISYVFNVSQVTIMKYLNGTSKPRDFVKRELKPTVVIVPFVQKGLPPSEIAPPSMARLMGRR